MAKCRARFAFMCDENTLFANKENREIFKEKARH